MKKPLPAPTRQQFHDLSDKAATTQVQPKASVPERTVKPESSSVRPASASKENIGRMTLRRL